jgi:putative SOS response-associated peptidase YedK
MFRSAFRRDRCVLPASGFFEWQRQENASYPYYFYPKNDPGLLLAGIVLESSPGSASRAVALLTRAADPWMSEIHHRAPVLVRKKCLHEWLSCPDPETPLSHFCHATEDGTLSRHPVSDRVNRITENCPEILKPVPEPEVLTQGQLFS